MKELRNHQITKPGTYVVYYFDYESQAFEYLPPEFIIVDKINGKTSCNYSGRPMINKLYDRDIFIGPVDIKDYPSEEIVQQIKDELTIKEIIT